MSFYSETKTSHKGFENGELVTSEDKIMINDNGNIILAIKDDDTEYKPKIGVEGLKTLLLEKSSQESLPERLKKLANSLDKLNKKSNISSKSKKGKSEKNKKTSSKRKTLKKEKLKHLSIKPNTNTRKKRKQKGNKKIKTMKK